MQTLCLLLIGASTMMMIHNLVCALQPLLCIFGAARFTLSDAWNLRSRASILIGLPITQVRAGGKANKFRSLPNKIPTTCILVAQIKPATSLFEILLKSASAPRLSLISANITSCFSSLKFPPRAPPNIAIKMICSRSHSYSYINIHMYILERESDFWRKTLLILHSTGIHRLCKLSEVR
jgi:hypothetical protein